MILGVGAAGLCMYASVCVHVSLNSCIRVVVFFFLTEPIYASTVLLFRYRIWDECFTMDILLDIYRILFET